MNRVSQFSLLGILLAVTLVLSGCGKGGPVGSVTGKVTLPDGNTAAGLLVRFLNESAGIGATAILAEDGTYSLKHKGETGIPIGTYNIAVTAYVKEMTDEEMTAFLNLPAAEQKKINAERYAKLALVPEKYHTTTTSGLSYEIIKGPQTFDIVLTE